MQNMTRTTQNEGRVSNVEFTMRSNFSCYQLKIDYYRYKLLDVNLKATTKQNPIVNIQKIKRNKYKHTTKESH